MSIRHYAICLLMLVLAVGFAQAYTWTATSSLPEARKDAGLVFYNGYIYLVGGRGPAEATTPNPHAVVDVYYAKVNSNGSIGAWAATSSLPAPRACLGAAAYNGYLYAFGGWDDAYATHGECYYAPIQPNGSVGAWVTSAVTIPPDVADAQMDAFGQGIMIFNDTLYIVNGEDNAGSAALHPEVYYSKVQGSHDYGTWTATSSTPQGSWFHGVITYAGSSANYIYRVAGNYSGTSESDTFVNTIGASGALVNPSWTQTVGSLPSEAAGRYEFACALADNKIFIIGGITGATPVDTVFYGEIDPATGDIASWTQDSSAYPTAISRNQAIGYSMAGGEYILAVSGGGYYSTDTWYPECYYAVIKVPPPPTPTPTPEGFTAVESSDWMLYE